MLQVDWQQEAARARSLVLAAHKGSPLDALLRRTSANLDLEAPQGSATSLEAVPEQASLPGIPVFTSMRCIQTCKFLGTQLYA